MSEEIQQLQQSEENRKFLKSILDTVDEFYTDDSGFGGEAVFKNFAEQHHEVFVDDFDQEGAE